MLNEHVSAAIAIFVAPMLLWWTWRTIKGETVLKASDGWLPKLLLTVIFFGMALDNTLEVLQYLADYLESQ